MGFVITSHLSSLEVKSMEKYIKFLTFKYIYWVPNYLWQKKEYFVTHIYLYMY